MANEVFNVAKGRFVQWFYDIAGNTPSTSGVTWVLLKTAETDATLRDYDTLGALLGSAGNDEADFTNYARKTRTDADISTPSPNDSSDRYDLDLPDETWSSAGGASNNTIVKAILVYWDDVADSGSTDTNGIPIAHYDFSVTTNGGDVTLQVNAAGAVRAA